MIKMKAQPTLRPPRARTGHGKQPLQARDLIAPLSPAVAVAALIETSLDYRADPDRAVERLCRLVEQKPVAQLSFSRAQQAARLLSRWADPSNAVRPSQLVSIVSEPPVLVEPRTAEPAPNLEPR